MLYVASPADRPWLVSFQASDLASMAEALAAQPPEERSRLVVVASQDGHARQLNAAELAALAGYAA